jgi:hypothetical protein
MRRLSPSAVRVLVGVVMLLVAVAPVASVSADAQRAVGPYRIRIGFATTPVYPEEGHEMVVHVTTAAGEPVTGLESTLRLRVSLPNQASETMVLNAIPNDPGGYGVELLLPRAADYDLDLLGTIEGQQVAEHFVTGHDGIAAVIAPPDSYPRGAAYVVIITFAAYVVGVAFLVGWAALSRYRRTHRPAAPRA